MAIGTGEERQESLQVQSYLLGHGVRAHPDHHELQVALHPGGQRVRERLLPAYLRLS